MKKHVILGLLSLSLSLSFSAATLAGEWKQDKKGWWYSHEDGSYPAGTWSHINGHWYYFDDIGYMAESRWIGDYYLGQDGAMLVSTVTPDGYTVDVNGKWISSIPRSKKPVSANTVHRSSGGGSRSSSGSSSRSSGGGSYSSSGGSNSDSSGSYNSSGSDNSSGSYSTDPVKDGQIRSLIAQGLSVKEAELYLLINAYRAASGLPKLSLSRSLTTVARLHVLDSNTNTPQQQYTADGRKGNLHSWSFGGSWQGVVYTSDHEFASLMWSKPRELTNYTGDGFEISVWNSGGMTPQAALAAWQLSSGHNGVILGEGNWSQLKTMGVAIDGLYSHVWFGKEEDPDGYIDLENYEVVYP